MDGRICKFCEVRFWKQGSEFCSIKCRILGKIEKKENGCWIWNGGKSGDGYGAIKVNGRQISTHRQAFKEFIGEIYQGLCVCHKCDQPLCCNPDHLFLGTPKENTKDSVKKCRARCAKQNGSQNHSTKLDETIVRQIKELFSKGYMVTDLHDLTGIPLKTLEGIKYNITWRHVNLQE
jgi:hypothetical protein